MYKKLFSGILGILFVTSSLFAQRSKDIIWGSSVAYQYQKAHFAKVSVSALFEPAIGQYMRVNAGVDFGFHSSRPKYIPEISATYFMRNFAVMPYIQTDVTPYHITPKVGVALFSLVEIGMGYGFDFNTRKGDLPIKGLTTTVGVNIPFNFHLF